MKNTLTALLVLGLSAAVHAGSGHDHHDAKGAKKETKAATTETKGEAKGETSVKGEVLDLACYFGHGAMGKKHTGCAKKCLTEGMPAGLLGEDGQVYLLLEDHGGDTTAFDSLPDHAGKTVTVSGTLAKKGGLQAIIVKKVAA